jgi:DNA-binding transcriptional LysR family regulator
VSLPQVVVNFGSAHLTPADRRLSELGFKRDPHVKTTSFLTMPSIIAGTDLVGVVPRRLVDQTTDGTSVIGVDPPFGKVDLYQTLWWHHSHNNDEGHAWLRRILTSRPV